MKVVMIGLGEIATVECDAFDHDSPYEVVAFAAEAEHFAQKNLREFLGRPAMALEAMRGRYDPAEYGAFVAMGDSRLSHDRERVYSAVKAMGYRLVSYVSSRATLMGNVTIGDNCYIGPGCVLEYGVSVGDDVTLWGGDYFCHRVTIGDHVFCSARVSSAGFTKIGDHCFLGVGCTLGNRLTIARHTFIGGGTAVMRSTREGEFYKTTNPTPMPYSSLEYCKVKE